MSKPNSSPMCYTSVKAITEVFHVSNITVFFVHFMVPSDS